MTLIYFYLLFLCVDVDISTRPIKHIFKSITSSTLESISFAVISWFYFESWEGSMWFLESASFFISSLSFWKCQSRITCWLCSLLLVHSNNQIWFRKLFPKNVWHNSAYPKLLSSPNFMVSATPSMEGRQGEKGSLWVSVPSTRGLGHSPLGLGHSPLGSLSPSRDRPWFPRIRREAGGSKIKRIP